MLNRFSLSRCRVICLATLASLVVLMGLVAAETNVQPSNVSAVDSEMAKAADKLAKAFPTVYWHAADACMRETTRNGNGFPGTVDNFVRDSKVTVEKVFRIEPEPGRGFELRLKLVSVSQPNLHWAWTFRYLNNRWEPMAGYKFEDRKIVSDMFKDEYFAGMKLLGSMRPYIKKALEAYDAGKDPATVFKK